MCVSLPHSQLESASRCTSYALATSVCVTPSLAIRARTRAASAALYGNGLADAAGVGRILFSSCHWIAAAPALSTCGVRVRLLPSQLESALVLTPHALATSVRDVPSLAIRARTRAASAALYGSGWADGAGVGRSLVPLRRRRTSREHQR